jgi:hypothetical protein
MSIHIEEQEKLTMEELCDRLGNEFDDVDLRIHDSPTKGTVAVVYFYEDKIED